jgi:outer membrane protein OmpA-like peptidoglycan-associated protein
MLKLVRIVAIGLLLGAAPLAIAQENFSANDIVDALTPKEKTRGLTVTETNIDDELENEAILAMRALGAALRDERLKDYRFQIIGHTDAKGSDAYNLELSKRRAAAVVEHLVFFHNVDAGRLVAIGMGESDPANTADPDAAENRRVEIINVGS